MENLYDSQKPYARPAAETKKWRRNRQGNIELLEVVKRVQPTILIGCSSQTGAFNKTVIKTLLKTVAHPIILPLSNPNEKAEAVPQDLINWSNNQAIIATGSPYPPVVYKDQHFQIPQNNNALIFPGIGLGVIVVNASQITNDMLWQACEALAECSPNLEDPEAPILPLLAAAPKVAKKIAYAVARAAIKAGVAREVPDDLEKAIEDRYWTARYLPYRKL